MGSAAGLSIEAIRRGRDPERPAGISRERTVTVGPGESAHVVFALDGEPVRLHGRIELGGRAPRYAVVRAHGLSIEALRATYTDGQYEMLLPSSGAYVLSVSADGMHCQPQVDVPEAAEHRFDLSLPLERITGVVGDDAGSPLAGITVDASSWQEQLFRCSDRAITDERGAYTLELPPGTYRINPREDFEKERSFFESEDTIVLLQAGAPLTGVDFELRTANALEGFVRFPDGSPAAGAGISVVSARGGRETWQTERARADGSFRVQSLAAGEHLVRGGFAESEEGPYFLSRESLAVEVRAGVPSSIALELVPATRLRVNLTDASGAALDARVEVLDSRGHADALRKKEDGLTIESGVPVWHEIVLVAPGPFTLRADHARGLFERAFSLAGVGPLVELEFRVE